MVLVMTGLAFVAVPTYSSTSAFMAHTSGSTLAGLSNIASQLGVSVGKEDPTESPDFYAEVVKSRDLLTTLALDQYKVNMPGHVRSGALADVLDIKRDTPALRL